MACKSGFFDSRHSPRRRHGHIRGTWKLISLFPFSQRCKTLSLLPSFSLVFFLSRQPHFWLLNQDKEASNSFPSLTLLWRLLWEQNRLPFSSASYIFEAFLTNNFFSFNSRFLTKRFFLFFWITSKCALIRSRSCRSQLSYLTCFYYQKLSISSLLCHVEYSVRFRYPTFRDSRLSDLIFPDPALDLEIIFLFVICILNNQT